MGRKLNIIRMENVSINHFAVFAAALSMFIIGGLWYSPTMFGKQWLKILNKDESFLKTGNKGKIFGVS
ncbi:MAG: DUF1761 domain-containing protein, partial [Gelidibacter sp.]|nr:DUF1761 domain-containing protein [Gelidibacter sp.]